jgi:uncharacterized membrane protein (UPF0127 family)
VRRGLIIIEHADGRQTSSKCAITETREEAERGLKGWRAPFEPMVFPVHRAGVTFVGVGLAEPVDIAFVNRFGVIERAGALGVDDIVSVNDFVVSYAVEFAQGSLQRRGIAVGDRVMIRMLPR